MRALQIQEWGGELVEVEVERRPLEPGEVRLRVLACGVGLTVLNAIDGDLRGDRGAGLPRVPGHELCGEVIESADPSVQVGERGLAYFYLTCGRCWFCTTGREPLCENFAGFVGTDIDGGYAEESVIPARNFVRIPDSIDPVAATAISDAIATPVHVCRARARIEPGEIVAVVGAAGGVGIHLVQVAALHGAVVAGIDIGAEKLAAVREVGAAHVFEAGVEPAELARALGRAPDVVVDTVGTDETHAWSLEALGRGGRLVVLTTFPGSTITASPPRLVFEEIAILGSRFNSYADLARAIRLVADGRVRPVVTATVRGAEVRELHRQLRERSLIGRGAVTF